MTIETKSGSTPDMIETALNDAERTGFKIAAVGRTIAVTLIALAFLPSYYFPINIGISAITLAIALIGLTSLAAIGTRYEIKARFALFAFDATVVTVLLAFIPLSSGGDIPQNLVFLTSSVQYYYVVVAASVLTLSPPIVIWTGSWATGGLIFATWWIRSGMDKVLSYGDLPIAPSPEIFFETVLSPNFLGMASRVQEALIIALVTAIAALAVHRARRVCAITRARRQVSGVCSVFLDVTCLLLYCANFWMLGTWHHRRGSRHFSSLTLKGSHAFQKACIRRSSFSC
ncbi:hypothetical protein ACU8NH_27260 (plasmid) [Rhizobium leguminosarum]